MRLVTLFPKPKHKYLNVDINFFNTSVSSQKLSPVSNMDETKISFIQSNSGHSDKLNSDFDVYSSNADNNFSGCSIQNNFGSQSPLHKVLNSSPIKKIK